MDQIALDKLPENLAIHILTFLVPTKNDAESLDFDLDAHNMMNSLYQGSEGFRRVLDQVDQLPSLAKFRSLAPYSLRLGRVQAEQVSRLECSGETRGGTGREGVWNLFRDGDFDWSKWFDPNSSPEGGMWFVRISIHRPVPLVAYGIKSANDCPEHDPEDWDLCCYNCHRRRHYHQHHYRGYGQGRLGDMRLHQVRGADFSQRYQTKWYAMPTQAETDVVRLSVMRRKGRATRTKHGYGMHIAQLFLFYVEE